MSFEIWLCHQDCSCAKSFQQRCCLQVVGPFIGTYHVAVALHKKECKDKQVDFTGILDTNYI